jgi:hypothetical protein
MNLDSLREHRPQAKANCSKCGRPLSIMRSGTCIYCGHVNDAVILAKDASPGRVRDAAALLAQLETPAPQKPKVSKWGMRFLALGLGALLVWMFVGPCMR